MKYYTYIPDPRNDVNPAKKYQQPTQSESATFGLSETSSGKLVATTPAAAAAVTTIASTVPGGTVAANIVRSNKENSKPTTTEVYIKKPRTCTLLDVNIIRFYSQHL